ncbi:MAG: shikimate kinase [Actinomycetota bacterium]|nr:shikimate kinase [Actinomycetota bacterium]
MTLVLIGPPGAGKTRLGKRVARALDLPFIDTDKRIVADHGAIAEIFATHGEAHFRAIERAEVQRALGEDAVVSLGGGAILDPDTQAELASHRVALVTVSAEAVESRIGDKRPLLTGGIESWRAMMEARGALYESLGDRSWDTSKRPIETIAKEIALWAREAMK